MKQGARPMRREAARFLNLDLELEAAGSLSRLRKHLERSAFILFHGRVDGSYRLCAEPLLRGNLSNNIRTCTAHFLGVLETLPAPVAAVWDRCVSRVFDYGFDGGLESKPLSVAIASAQLQRMALLGIQLRTTVYPHRFDNDALGRPPDRM